MPVNGQNYLKGDWAHDNTTAYMLVLNVCYKKNYSHVNQSVTMCEKAERIHRIHYDLHGQEPSTYICK